MASHIPEPGLPGTRSDRDRPRIWATGRQRPGFDLRAFVRVSLTRSRALAVPLLGTSSARLARFADRVEEGAIRIPEARLGRTGRLLPSHVTTGRSLRDTAALLRVAGDAARGAAPVEGLAFRGWDTGPGDPAGAGVAGAPPPDVPATPVGPAPVQTAEPRAPAQRPKRPAPLATPDKAEADRDTLEAIRSLIHTAHVEPQHPQRRVPPPPPVPTGIGALPELAPAEPAPRGAVFRLTGRVLGAATVGLVLPLGMAQAGLAFARGEDLRLLP